MGNNQIKISDLQQLNAEQMNSSEVLEISQEENSELKSRKSTLSRIGTWLGTVFNFNNLNTNNKSIVGAINEKITSGVACYGAAAHNSVYRGKWLGTAPTEEQLDAIEDGSFDNLFIGDFWSNDPDDPNEIRWRIAGFNYYQNTGYSYGDGVVLRNHAVIMPDSAIVLQNDSAIETTSGVYHNGGYKYTKLRGYEGTYESISNNNRTKTGNIVTLHNLSHIPSHVICLRSSITVYDSSGVAHSGAEIAFDIIDYGEDPDNPGKGYVRYNDKNFSVLYSSSDIFPNQWDLSFYEQYYTVECMYKYYTGVGGLLTAKQIIFDKFGEEHVMKHKIPLTVTKKASYNPYLYDLTYQSEWTEVTVEAPTSEMIFGNAPCSSFGEYELDEYSRQMSRKQPTYIINADANNVDKPYSIPDSIRKPLNSVYCPHIEMYQLPLFVYDPALIHNRYGYWLRNIYTYDLAYNNASYLYYNQHHYTCLVDGYGHQWGRDYNSYYNSGTRPFFCLAKYNTPQPTEEENE